MNPWDIKAQNERRVELAALVRAKLRPLLDADARAQNLVWWDQGRVAIWASNAFFLGDPSDIAFANVILRYVRDVLNPQPGPNVFESSAMATVLSLYSSRLDEDVRAFAMHFLETMLPHGTTHDFQFRGYNDNFPVMWTWALAAGGELLGNRRFSEVARANLRLLKNLLRRRGSVAEYGANYSTHRLTSIAHIAELSRNEEMRSLALEAESRLWAEIAGHWHPAFAQICGAAMRGGPPWMTETSALLRQVFGDKITIPAMPWREYYEAGPKNTVRELGLDPGQYVFAFPFAYGSEFASAEYHVPDSVAELFYQKPKGFTFRCTSENGYFNAGIFCKQEPVYGQGGVEIVRKPTTEAVVIKDYPEHGAQPHGLITYHGANYAIGTSSAAQFPTSHAFRCAYRRLADAKTPADYGNVLVRYNINDKIAGGRLKNRYWKSPEHPEELENYGRLYHDMGSYHCLQHANTVLCLMTPHYLEYWDIRSLRADLFFHQPHRKVEKINQSDTLITVDEGATYLAIHPLIGRFQQRRAAVKIGEVGEFLQISLYNYEGPSIQFTAHEIAKLGNGFVFEARDAEDYHSFAEFEAEMRNVRILDQLSHGCRRVHYARPDLRLSTEFCPYTKHVMSDSVNGLNHEIPQFAYSDGRHKGLPWLDGTPAPGFEDWDWIQTQLERPAETYNVQD